MKNEINAPALLAERDRLREALSLLWDAVEDLSGSNPGFLGKLVLQDYARWNEAFIKARAALRAQDFQGAEPTTADYMRAQREAGDL